MENIKSDLDRTQIQPEKSDVRVISLLILWIPA